MGTDTSDQEELGRESGHAEETGVVVHATTRLLYAEYLAIGGLLVEQLVRGEELGVQVKDLTSLSGTGHRQAMRLTNSFASGPCSCKRSLEE